MFNQELGNVKLHAKEVYHFNNESNGNPIFKFVNRLSKMYTFTVFDSSELIPDVNDLIHVRHNGVAKSVTRI